MQTAEQINPFVLPLTSYVRDVNIFRQYMDQTAAYLSKMTGKPLEHCLEYIRNALKPGGRFEFKDPKITYTERGDNGDRELKEGTLYTFLTQSIKERDIISPTFATYYHPKKKKSLLASYINTNKKRRNVAKKEMFAAEMAKDYVLHAFKKGEQTNAKQKNNSLSGASLSSSTPLFLPTAHSSLTSTCRATSGYGNANNEKFLGGNRHYWSPMIVTNNIVSIITHTDYERLERVIQAHNLVLPSVEQVMSCITSSTRNYWRIDSSLASIRRFVERLSALERAAFVYTGDLYQIRELNPAMMRVFITRLAARVETPHADPVGLFKTCFEDHQNLAMQICSHVSKGKTLKDMVGTEAHGIVAATAENIANTLQEYAEFIQAFFVTDNVPASMAFFPDSIRYIAMTGDTDSTILTAQEWVEWYAGYIGFSDECNNVSSTAIFLASASITHVLAKMSANLGVDADMIDAIAMKNEYKFDVFVPTQVGKHYYAVISTQEGNVFDKLKVELKGVHLKNSNVSKAIMKRAKAVMVETMESVMREEPIDLKKYLKEFADIERNIVRSIGAGEHEFFRFGRINSADSYKQTEDRSNYKHYLMWQEVFAPDYGSVPPPPYTCLKLSTTLDTMGKTREWLAKIENRALAERMRLWLDKYNKSYIGMVMLPEGIVQARGIPKELLAAVDIRNMVTDTTNVFYIIAETYGVYMKQDKMKKLFMDYY